MREPLKRRARALFAALGAAAFLSCDAGDALAFCRSRACDKDWALDDAMRIPCVANNPPWNSCYVTGAKLHWPTNCLSFSVQKDGSAASGIDLETAEAVIEAAFETWRGSDCGGGATPSFTFVNRGEVECRRAEYNEDQPNANVFLFRDDAWPHQSIEGVHLGLTTVTYNVHTGEIVDADVEFNTRDNTFTIAEDGVFVRADFPSIATHEIGHFLGLSHSTIRGTTMSIEGYDGTTLMRTLERDDIDGVCEIYPPGGPLSDRCGIRHGFSGKCAGPREEESGCAFAPARRTSSLAPLLALALFAVSRRTRRFRR